MLPGDEQLVPFGEDSTLSIQRTVKQASTVAAVTLRWDKADGRRRLAGARLTHHEAKATTYTVKNNATAGAAAGAAGAAEAAPTPLYIDHEADPRHGGYAIETVEGAIKRTTAFQLA